MNTSIAAVVRSHAMPSADGIVLHDWVLPADQPLRGMAVLVHGLGEHARRYDHVAARLNALGFQVRGYDHFGHGASPGRRGDLAHPQQLLDHLSRVVESAGQEWGPRTPMLLLGHSMGGLVAARWTAQRQQEAGQPVHGLVLSSPALQLHMTMVQKMLVNTLPHVLPHLQVSNGLQVESISHDPAVVQAYRQDPLVHDRISAMLAQFMLREGEATRTAATQWRVPTLLMYALEDTLVDPQGSRQFAAMAPAGMVQAQACEGCYHEIFNETQERRQAVFDCLEDWIQRHF